MNKYILFAAFCVAVSACANKKKVAEVEDQAVVADWYLAMEKTPCFGSCPIYKIEVNKNGEMYLNARRFMDITGKFSALITDQDLTGLKSATKGATWTEYDSAYMTGYSDLPSTILSFSTQVGDTTTIQYESKKAPQELRDLASRLKAIQKKTKWESVITD